MRPELKNSRLFGSNSRLFGPEFPFVWSQFPFVWPVAASYSRSAEALFPFVASNSSSFHLLALVVAVMRVLAVLRVSPPMARHGR